jgi:O-antigen/teichoic acid export membrane protein
MVVHGTATVAAIALFVVLIPEYGALGAALSILGSRIVSCLISFACTARKLGLARR